MHRTAKPRAGRPRRVLIIVENLPVPFDRRVWSEATTLRQDIAVTLPDDVPARDVLHALHKAGGEMLGDAEIFDVYTGSQVGEGRRSLALSLSFNADDRTLTDEDVAPVREQIVAALGELGGELRG